MARLKPVRPSLREKKRYIVFEIISKQNRLDGTAIHQALMTGATQYMGRLGMAKAGLKIMDDLYDPKTQRGIVKVSHKEVDNVCVGFGLIQEIESTPAIVHVRGVSGILKRAKEKFLAS